MTKSDIIKIIHQNADYNYKDIETIVDLLFETIATSLHTEDKIVISGFGTFEKYYQDGYKGVNPSTGEPLLVDGAYKIRFNISKKHRHNLNKKGNHEK